MTTTRVPRLLALAMLAGALAGCATVKPVTLNCPARLAPTYFGPEDIEIDVGSPDGARLIVSSQERRATDRLQTFSSPGNIVAIPVAGDRRGTAFPLPLVNRDPGAPFHPHGISLVRTSTETLLYVINHNVGRGGIVEVFRLDGDRLIARGALPESELLSRPNDLVALSNGDVYVTNLTGQRSDTADLFATLLGRGSGSVLGYRAGRGWKTVADGIGLANGILATPDRRQVLVAGSSDRGIHVYDVDLSAGTLQERRKDFIRVGNGLDNLTWERPGRTLIAARHPDSLAFLRHAKSPDRQSPSMIQRVTLGDAPSAATIYANPGVEISAASVGLVWMDALYIGQVFDQGVLRCVLPPGDGAQRNAP